MSSEEAFGRIRMHIRLCFAKIHLSRRRLIFINEADTLWA